MIYLCPRSSSNSLFCLSNSPKLKDIKLFNNDINQEKQQRLILERLGPANVHDLDHYSSKQPVHFLLLN